MIIHPNEQGHNKEHLHAQYQDKEVVIAIPSGEIISGNIPIKKKKIACNWVINNSDYLIRQWNELNNSINIPAI